MAKKGTYKRDEPSVTKACEHIEVGPEIELCWKRIEKEAVMMGEHGQNIDFEKFKNLSLEEKQQLALAEIGIPARTLNALEDHFGILFVKQLLQLRRSDLMNVPRLAEVSIDQIYDSLRSIGLTNRRNVLD